jgi:serine/threonine protein kinase
MNVASGPSLPFDHADAAYDLLAVHVGRFVEAWEAGGGPPSVVDYLPQGSPAVRRLGLIELIKVDLEYRQQRGCLRPLSEYFDAFPELCDGGEVPFDLIYEDFHIRKQGGETVVIQPYFERFPQHRSRLEQLLGMGDPYRTTRAVPTKDAVEVGPGQQLDDFDLIKELGAGAFAKVFLARQVSMQRFVALKVSADKSDEPQTLAQLDHPHIVRVYDQRIVPERHLRLLYMQYIPGGTLQDVVKTAQQLPDRRSGKLVLDVIDAALASRGELLPSEGFARRALNDLSWAHAVCRIGASLAAALDYAHRRGVLHRDVKPANVLLTSEGSPKLADFNISFSSQVEGASPREFFGGSLTYMSPEQLEAYDPNHSRQPEEMDGRSDIYSLGVLLWEMLTGRRPFEDQMLPAGIEATIRDMTHRRRRGVPAAAIRQLPDDCPQGLKEVLLRCLAPEPADRFADAGQLARQLELCLSDAHDLLYPPAEDPWRRRVRRWPFGWALLALTPRSWPRAAAAWPLVSVVVAGVLPNLLMSLVNITYNGGAITKMVGFATPQEWLSSPQVMIVNAIAYPLGVVWLGYCFWPIKQGSRQIRRGVPLDPEQWRTAGRYCLRLGLMAWTVTLTLWIVTSLVFPIWIQLAHPEIEVSVIDYVHFVASQAFCGLIAASLTYFFITFIAVRAFFPRLIPPNSDDPQMAEELNWASSPVTFNFLVLALVPVVSMTLAFYLFYNGMLEGLTADPEVPLAFVMLGFVGFVGLIVCWFLRLDILVDLAALQPAVCDSQPSLPRDAEAALIGSTRRSGLSESSRRTR